MRLIMHAGLLGLILALSLASAWAEDDEEAKYADAMQVFLNAGESGAFFDNSYGYAIFPTIGKAGFVVGGAYGKGRVYIGGNHVGDTTMTQLSVGFQLGGQAYSEIIFFQDQRAFDEFRDNFEFGAQATAVAVTAGVSAGASTTGASAGASGGKYDATTVGSYYKGMAVFIVAKGGLMYEASVSGQKFTYTPR
jgi:lipid-binding SYLF domain-containing protein